jgi:hypothetical protein
VENTEATLPLEGEAAELFSVHKMMALKKFKHLPYYNNKKQQQRTMIWFSKNHGQTNITDFFPYKRCPAMKRQTTMLDFYKPKTTLNFQSYPMEHCIFEVRMQKFVYQPPKYIELGHWKNYPVYCPHCELKPCVTIGHHDQIYGYLKEECKGCDLCLGVNKSERYVKAQILKDYFPCSRPWRCYQLRCVRSFSRRILGEWLLEMHKDHQKYIENLLDDIKSGKVSGYERNGIIVSTRRTTDDYSTVDEDNIIDETTVDEDNMSDITESSG